MDLFGSIMFSDSNSSSVSLMYLQFVEDLSPQGVNYYNWGGAVLACLYRELSRVSRYKLASIHGPLLLLQMWSWTRFAIGRPIPHNPEFGDEVMDERLAFGAKWTIPHDWGGNPRRGTKQCRDQFERLKANVVNWRPYRGYQYLQPSVGIRDKAFFTCRVWCIHLWVVEIHLPERVFRQFGLFQAVPPPAPPSFKDLEEIRKWTRADGLYGDATSAD
ncbi:serine/threonine-protein phosphatase 7 long form homolog isoform X1 [Carex rostrata]